MDKIHKTLDQILEKDKIVKIVQIVLVTIGFIMSILSIFGSMILAANYFGDSSIGLITAILGMNTLIIGGCYILYQIGMIPFRIMGKVVKKGFEISKLLKKEKIKLSNIDNILIKTQLVKNTLLNFLRIRKIFGFFLTNNTNYVLDGYAERISNETLELLSDLRSDLATRLTEQQQILEGAKSEVERNLTGTPELLAVSEAQKLRLDRQIEQFEELQRVLVKM